MRGLWLRIAEYWRAMRRVWLAQRELKSARRLRDQGRPEEALRAAEHAFQVLTREFQQHGDPAAQAILATDAVLLDQLACDVGQPQRARSEIERALQLCTNLIFHSPKLEPKLRGHIAWYTSRLADIGQMAAQ